MQLPNNAISATDAANIVGISLKHLREILREGKIKSIKIKKYWYVDLDSLNEYINRNGSQRSEELEINGEHAIKLHVFAQKRGIRDINCLSDKVVTHKINGAHYITDSEARRYDRRFKEYCGRKIIPAKQASELMRRSADWIRQRIHDGELETVKIDGKVFVFVDSLEKLEERIQAGDDFLSIPNGRIRRAEVIQRLIEEIEEEQE